PPRWWGPSARTNLHLDKWDRRDEGPRTRPGMTDVTARSRPFSQVEHLRGEDGLGVGDAQGVRPLVGHGQETPDAPGDGVLGQRRVGQRTELLQARLLVLQAQLPRLEQVLGHVVTEDQIGRASW